MANKYAIGLLSFCLAFGAAADDAPHASKNADPMDRYNVVWNTPSQNCLGSMPLGNGDIGLNVWVEENGDLRFYISKSDSWDDLMRLVKVGRMRIQLSPNPFVKGASFRQILRLRQGEIEIQGGSDGRDFRLVLWVDANQPVIHLEARGKQPFTMCATSEVWRENDRDLPGNERWYVGDGSVDKPIVAQPPLIVHADTVWPSGPKKITWFHRNDHSIWSDNLKLQGLGELIEHEKDPLMHRTFGAIAQGEGLVSDGPLVLRSLEPGLKQSLDITLLTAQTSTPEEWVKQVNDLADKMKKKDIVRAQAAHRQWWNEFWNRSWIRVPPETQRNEPREIDTGHIALHIGADEEGISVKFPKRAFKGDIARVRVFNRVLTPEEIAGHARQELQQISSADSNCVADWTFDQKQGDHFLNGAPKGGLPAVIKGEVEMTENGGRRCIRLLGKGSLEVTNEPGFSLGPRCTFEAWVAPQSSGRLLDKCTWDFPSNWLPQPRQGFFFELNTNNSLRLGVQSWEVTAPTPLKLGAWAHVVATTDLLNGEQRIYVDGQQVAFAQHDASTDVSRGYTLQRFINACAGRGAFPIKFNGSIFNTVNSTEYPESGHWTDYRGWGGPYWLQNSRLIYWPMLTAGDYEMMRPYFRMFRDALPLASARTPLYFGHKGAFFPETMCFWGTYSIVDYHSARTNLHMSEIPNPAIRYHFTGSLELLAMMLDYEAHIGDRKFIREELLPLADELLLFFDKHWKRDLQGRLRMEPSQCVESYYPAVNPANDLAGLKCVLNGLLALPDKLLGDERRQRWTRLRDELPPLPTMTEGGHVILKAAEDKVQVPDAWEGPELYSVFPFPILGVGKPDIGLARATYTRRPKRWIGGWFQDDIWAACLGMADEARSHLVWRFATKNPENRFPAFWGPNFDHIPDQDHGGVGMIALQKMLLQSDGDKILLFPAWPKDWDVDFKLRAPQDTTVEGVLRAGRIEKLVVTPKKRLKDVVRLDPQ